MIEKITAKNISVIKNHADIVSTTSIEEVYRKIIGNAYKDEVMAIRNALRSGDNETASKLKKALAACTFSGTFNGRRRTDCLASYSGYLILDMDKLNAEELQHAKDVAKRIPYTVLCFVSPSGNGLKIVVAVNTDQTLHKEAYAQVVSYYNEEIGLPFDDVTSDVSRLCYMSHDPEAYINYNYEVFTIEKPSNETITTNFKQVNNNNMDNNEILRAFEYAVKYTSNKIVFEKDTRNNYVFTLARNCNCFGLPFEEVSKFAVERFVLGDFKAYEVMSSFKSAYTRKEMHGTWTLPWNRNKERATKTMALPPSTIIKKTTSTQASPFLPDSVYGILPEQLQSVQSALKTQREKDVFTTGLLTLLSGCMPNVTGIYDNSLCHANLYSFVVAPPASGKSVLNTCRKIMQPLHNQLIAESEANLKTYRKNLAAYESAKVLGKVGTYPTKPAYKQLYVPANSTAHTLFQHLSDNNGQGIIFENEADSLGYLLRNDDDTYANIIKNSFHNETISYCRKRTDETVFIDEPAMAMILSGTPQQVVPVMRTLEDGMYSRFAIYHYNDTSTWKNVQPSSDYSAAAWIKQHNNEWLQMGETLQKLHLNFNLTNKQWDTLNTTFSKQLEAFKNTDDENFTASIKRMGIITYKLAMVLSVMQVYTAIENNTELICTDHCFQTALELGECYLTHAALLYDQISDIKKASIAPVLDRRLQFYNALPQQFDRKEAMALLKQIGLNISERTADSYLQRFVSDQLLGKQANGQYIKLQATSSNDNTLQYAA